MPASFSRKVVVGDYKPSIKGASNDARNRIYAIHADKA